MQIHVLYGLLQSGPGSWADTPMGRLPGYLRRPVAQVPKRVSAPRMVESTPECANRTEDLEAVA
jgi:hypothetical protein